jgi:hypothetical protein
VSRNDGGTGGERVNIYGNTKARFEKEVGKAERDGQVRCTKMLAY